MDFFFLFLLYCTRVNIKKHDIFLHCVTIKVNNGCISFYAYQHQGPRIVRAVWLKWSRAIINVIGYLVLFLLWHLKKVCCEKGPWKATEWFNILTLYKLYCRDYDHMIFYLCILPGLLLGWQVYPCWGLSAPSHSLWKCPWACGRAKQWGSLLSQSCHMKVPAADCWMKTGCSTTGSVGHSSQSSQCSQRSPAHLAYLRGQGMGGR